VEFDTIASNVSAVTFRVTPTLRLDLCQLLAPFLTNQFNELASNKMQEIESAFASELNNTLVDLVLDFIAVPGSFPFKLFNGDLATNLSIQTFETFPGILSADLATTFSAKLTEPSFRAGNTLEPELNETEFPLAGLDGENVASAHVRCCARTVDKLQINIPSFSVHC